MLCIRRFFAQNLRSFSSVELENLPDLVLLYGNNDAGKSNLLVGFALFAQIFSAVLKNQDWEGSTRPWPESDEQGNPLLDPIQSFLRYETGFLRVSGSVSWKLGEFQGTLHLSFEGTQDGSEPVLGMENEPAGQLKVDPLVVEGAALTPELRGSLAKLAGQGAEVAGESRQWHREYLPASGFRGKPTLGREGANLKVALFLLSNHPNRAERREFDQQLTSLIQAAPVDLMAPRMALSRSNELLLMLGDRPVEDSGSGTRQWAWLAAWAVATRSFALCVEEPEINLSWSGQEFITRLLAQIAKSRRVQIFATTHAPHLVNAVKQERWFEIRREGDVSKVIPQQGASQLWEGRDRPATIPQESGRKTLKLFSGNVVRLPDSAIAHLGAQVGDLLVSSEMEEGVVRLQTEHSYWGDS